MLDLVSALARPIAKLLLKSWLGDTAATAGDNLLKLAFDRLGDRNKAREAQQRADAIASAVVSDLQDFFAGERVDEAALTTAAFDLGETVGGHVDAAFLVHQRLDAAAIERTLLEARPVEGIFKPAEPEHDLYITLVKALAPRLRAVAPELPGFALERDAELLDKMALVADDTPRILAEVRAVRARVEEREDREGRQRADYETSYRKAVRQALNYVEILGLDVERTRREVNLSVAYLSLTTNMTGLGRLDYEALLDLLPAFGNRLLVEGAAGSGKSTLLRWTAVEAATGDRGDGGTLLRRRTRLIGHLAQCCRASAMDEEIGARLKTNPGWLAEFRTWLQESGGDDTRTPRLDPGNCWLKWPTLPSFCPSPSGRSWTAGWRVTGGMPCRSSSASAISRRGCRSRTTSRPI